MQDNIHAFLALASQCFNVEGPVHRYRSFPIGLNAAVHADPHERLKQPVLGQRGALVANRLGRQSPGSEALTGSAVKTIICIDSLERMFEARREVQAMAEAMAPGGVMLVAAPMSPGGQGDGDESWRYTPACLDQLLLPMAAKLIGTQGSAIFPHTVYAVACKPPVKGSFFHGANRFMGQFQAWLERSRRAGGWKDKLRRGVKYCLANRAQRERIRDHYNIQFIVHVQPGVALENTPAEPIAQSTSLGSRLNHWG